MAINPTLDPSLVVNLDDAMFSVVVAPTGSANVGALPAYVDIESLAEGDEKLKIRLMAFDRESLAQALRECARAIEFGIKSTREIEVTFMEG
jgi:hypothetical protein